MLKTRHCGIKRTEKLKGGGVALKTPKECLGTVILYTSIDPNLLTGKCGTCGFQHVEKKEKEKASWAA